jgi:dihydropyrimidinase
VYDVVVKPLSSGFFAVGSKQELTFTIRPRVPKMKVYVEHPKYPPGAKDYPTMSWSSKYYKIVDGYEIQWSTKKSFKPHKNVDAWNLDIVYNFPKVKRGQTVYVETCPQYLTLEDSVYYAPDYAEAARYVCAPPIRTENDQQALWKALRRGDVQTVSTDHCSFTLAQKELGHGDFTKIPGGLPGVETRGELLYTAGVAEGKISIGTMCRVLSENPAMLYGLYPRKGVIAEGSDADIVVYDPHADHILRADDMESRAGYSPYEGIRTKGSVTQVYLRGQQMVAGGKVVGNAIGQYLKRGTKNL